MLELNITQQRNICKRFPSFELCYEERIHKKVCGRNELYMAIPFGQKYFMWFTYFQDMDVCILIELYPNKKFKQMKIINSCFHEDLAIGKGTVLYGTLVDNSFFCVEDIYYLSGVSLSNKNYKHKLECIVSILNNSIKQISYSKSHLYVVVPPLSTSYDTLIKETETLPYLIYGIKFINYENFKATQKVFIHKKEKQKIIETFKVEASSQNDIYYASYYDSKKRELVKHPKSLLIPTYTTSVLMNTLFRDIKENRNLDSLEESDSEDEFQNTSNEKFLKQNKQLYMRCMFNIKFKKWSPIELDDTKTRGKPRVCAVERSVVEAIENKFIKRNQRRY